MAVLTNERSSIRFCLMRCEFERSRVVIESGGTPTIGVVAGSALCAKTAGMCVIINMAGRTIHGRAFEYIILMAVCTGGC